MKYKLGFKDPVEVDQTPHQEVTDLEDEKHNESIEAEHKSVDPDANKENENHANTSQKESNKDLKLDDSKQYKELQETPLAHEALDEQDQAEGEESESEHREQQSVNKSLDNEARFIYNGMNAQDNVVWSRDRNLTYYTSGNNIIASDVTSGALMILNNGHENEVSALAISKNGKLLASSSARADSQETAPIFIWNLDTHTKMYELRSHELGVKNLLFSKDGAYLISQGCNEERSLVLWDVQEGLVIKSTICPVPYSSVTLLENNDSKLMFATVGSDSYRLWKVDEDNELLFYDVELPESDLTLSAICSTGKLTHPYNAAVVLIGTVEGDIIINNPDNGQFLAKVNSVMQGTITLIET